ncbi:MAG: hypothetical protein AAB381_02715 [Patescibacteria group bacterium]
MKPENIVPLTVPGRIRVVHGYTVRTHYPVLSAAENARRERNAFRVLHQVLAENRARQGK